MLFANLVWKGIETMNVRKLDEQGIAVVHSDDVCIMDGQSALDFMITIQYETGCRSIVLNKGAVIETFFVLSTKLAGDVLQKVVNYHMRLAIVGDFASYSSKALQDFIWESNRGKQIFFVSSEEEAIKKLGSLESLD